MSASTPSTVEAERQVVEAAERYREVIASMEEGGRPETRQRAAVKAVARSLQLLAFVLQRAARAGVAPERLGELTGWEPDLVRDMLHRPPEPAVVARIAPPGIDVVGVAQAAVAFEAAQRMHALVGEMLADIDDEAWSPAGEDLDDLHDRVESVWQSWRRSLGRAGEAPSR